MSGDYKARCEQMDRRGREDLLTAAAFFSRYRVSAVMERNAGRLTEARRFARAARREWARLAPFISTGRLGYE